jgi:mRNA-degrading endonuclease RelE of RelBE toxin-antitoxin system
MRHYTTRRFRSSYDKLPAHVRKIADSKFKILQEDPNHPSLRLKKIGEFWSVRISRDYRALATQRADGMYWLWIGTHAEYDKLIQ